MKSFTLTDTFISGTDANYNLCKTLLHTETFTHVIDAFTHTQYVENFYTLRSLLITLRSH